VNLWYVSADPEHCDQCNESRGKIGKIADLYFYSFLKPLLTS
jgi:hypothetical protein